MTSNKHSAGEGLDLINEAVHKLRAPLAGVKWALRMLIDGDLGDVSKEQLEVLETCESNSERVLDLVNNILYIGQLDSGRDKYDMGEFDLRIIIDDIINEIGVQAQKNNVELDLFGEILGSVILRGDKEKIRTALENIIENAINYTRSGGKVSVTVERGEKVVTIRVADTGIGIPESEISTIFDKFTRASNAKEKISAGSGLGLFIAKGIIEHHRGTIALSSMVGEGTTFTINLPRDTRIS